MRVLILALLLLSFGRVFAADIPYSYTPLKFKLSGAGLPIAKPTVYFYDGLTYCTTYASQFGGPAACKYGGSSIYGNGLNQAWNFQITTDGKTYTSMQQVSASGYCDSGWEGPGSYRTTTYECRQVTVNTCPKGSMGTMTLTSAWATGPSTGSAYASKLIPDGAFAPVASGGYANLNYCQNSCVVVPSGVPANATIAQTASANGYYKVSLNGVPMTGTGASCQAVQDASPVTGAAAMPDPTSVPSEPTTPNTAAGKCPSGTTPGGTDPYGMTVCIGKASAPTAPANTTTTTSPTTTTTASDGTSTSTTSTSVANSDGSTTTTTTTKTTKPDGTSTVATTSSTGKTASGAQGSTDTPQNQKDLCTLHPELTMCRNSQVMGSCALTTCDGDAIQCATLRATSQMQCKQQADSDAIAAMPSTTLGNALLAGNDPMAAQIQTQLKGDSVDMSKSNLDQTGFIGGGACIPDKTFTVSGKSVTVSFSALCTNIQPLRFVIMSCAFLVAYLMVSRSVISGS